MRWLAVLVLLAIGCGSSRTAPPDKQPPAVTPADAAGPAERAATEVRVDRRVELMSILHRFGGGNEYRQAPAAPYVRAVDAHFGPFKDHPAVRATTALRAKHGVSWNAPMIIAVHLDDALALRNAAELPSLDARFAGVDLEPYLEQVRDFAAVTKLDEFLAAHATHHAAVADKLRVMVDAEDPVGWFDALFGKRAKARYVVVPGLLTGSANYGVRNTLPDGTVEMYQVLGVNTRDGLPPTDADMVALLIHEMAHSYINPVFDGHRAAFEPAGTALYKLVEDRMRAQAYGDWMTVINESGVRAVTALYLTDRKGAEAGAAAARGEVRRSFVWTHELVEMFRKFQRDRARYADLDAFVPQLVTFFDELVKRYDGRLPKLPFLGPFDAVARGEIVLASPPASASPEAARLAAYVKDIHAQFFAKQGRLVTGTDRTYVEAKGKGIVAYGSPASNPVVASLAKRASWKIEEDGITLGSKKFTGEHLVLIACWFRHDDPTRGVAVYTAARDADLIGVNSVFHGAKDWVVARRTLMGFKVVETGDWPHLHGAWVPF